MTRKILSLSLVMMLLVSTFSITGTFAASPIVFDGTTQVVFDQSFGGHSGASDLTDFNVTGSGWNYTKYFMIANGGGTHTVFTKANYDLSSAAEWTFTTKLSCTFNGYSIKLAYDETNKKGYTLCYSNNNKKLALYKDAVPTNALTKDASTDAMAAYVALDAYGTDNTITVNYVKATNTITIKNSVNANVITYTPEDGSIPNLNGKFGVDDSSAGVFTLFDMKLVKSNGKVTVNNWRYEKYFSTNDTKASLADEGITFEWDSPVINTDSVQFNNSGHTYAFNYKPAKRNFEGDYAVEFKASKFTTRHVIRFNYINSSNYYEMIAYRSYSDGNKGKVIITKHETDKEPVEIYNDSYGSVYIPNEVTLTYRLSLKKADGKQNINVYISDGSKSYTFDAVDKNPFQQSGYLTVNGAGTSNLYYIKAWSLVSEGDTTESISYAKNLLDLKFSATDTVAGIESNYPINLPDSTTFTDGLATYNATTYSTISVPELKTADNYSLEVKTKRGGSHAFFYWGYASTYNKSGYAIKVYNGYNDANDRYEFIKYNSSGTATILATVPTTSDWYVNNNLLTYYVSAKKKADGSVDFDITVHCSKKNTSYTMPTYNDTTPHAFSSYIAPYGQALYYAKADTVSTTTIGGDATSFNGIFYKDAGVNAIKEMVKGPVFFRHPTAILNNHVAVAVLYEDYKMTDMKTFKPAELYNETVKLFDTTNSNAEDIKIRVYFFDKSDNLNKLTETYEIN